MALVDRINSLDDVTAAQLIKQFGGSQPSLSAQAALDERLSRQLGDLFDVTEVPGVSQGALARAALLVLAQDPGHERGISALVENPRVEKYAFVETAILISAVLVVLETHIKFERGKDGRWDLKIEKKPTDSNLLKDLVGKLVSFSRGSVE